MKQIIINTVKTTVLLCLVFSLFTRCEDKGNYDYTEVSSLDSINDIEGTYTYSFGDTLRITPRFVFKQGAESDFQFTWYRSIDAASHIVIQEGRNLDIVIDTPFFKRNTNHDLIYEAKNIYTGGVFRKVFKVNVINTFQRGYVALCQKEGEMEIDLISLSSTNEFALYTNILSATGSTLPRVGVTPWDVLTFEDNTAPDPYSRSGDYSMYILTDRYTTRILPLDYSWRESYDIANMIEKGSYLDTAFLQKGLPVIAKKMQYTFLNTSGATLPRVFLYHEEPDGMGGTQGNWYFYNTYPILLQFSVQMNRVRTTSATTGQVRYEPAPFVAAGHQGTLYFDRTTGKFMYGSAPTSLTGTNAYGSKPFYYSEPFPASPPEPALNGVKYSDPNEGLVYMEEYKADYNSNDGYAILKMTDGSFRYLQFTHQSSPMMMMGAGKKQVSSFPAGTNIGNAKFFARDPSSSFLYYVTNDNKVYKANVSVNPAAESDITSSILSDGYDEITAFRYTVPQSYSLENVGIPFRTLAVGTYNAGLGLSEGGKLSFFQLTSSSSGDLELAKYPNKPKEDEEQVSMSWTGLGKIVGVTYKRK